jgi:hypothetical protein
MMFRHVQHPQHTPIAIVLLVLTVLAHTLSLPLPNAQAQETQALAHGTTDAVEVRQELVNLRTENTKIFEEPDGTRTAEIYTGPVHFKGNDADWHPIDNTLVPSSRPGYSYENDANSYRLYLPQDTSVAPVRIESGDYWVDYKLQGAEATLSVSGNTATYRNVLPGVDLIYEAKASGVKESFVVSSPQAARPLSFAMETSPGLSVKQLPTGEIELAQPQGRVVAALETPTMYERARGPAAASEAISYRLTRLAAGDHRLEVIPEHQWLASQDRSWPVVIDPTTTFTPTRDCWIGNGSDSNSSYCGAGSNYVRVGYNGSDKRRSLLKFDLSALPIDAYISDADLALYLDASKTTTGNGADYVARRIKSTWTSAVTWNKYDGTTAWTTPGGDFGTVDAGRTTLTGSTSGYKHFDATWLVRDWRDGTYPNHGFILKQDSPENVNNVVQFYSSNSSDPARLPKLSVTYGSGSINVASWSRSEATGRVSYSVTASGSGLAVAGGPCDGWCSWSLDAYYKDGTSELGQENLAGGGLAQETNSLSHTVTATEAPLPEITDLKLTISPNYDPPGRATYVRWIHVSDPYADGRISLSINQWDRDVDSGTTSYDLMLDITGAGQVNGPCESWCSWRVDAYYKDGTVEQERATLASGQGRDMWTHSQRLTATDAQLGEITHIRARLFPDYDPARETYDTGMIAVSDPYPTGYIDLSVNSWRRNHTAGTVSYDLTVDIAGAAQVNGPCESWCSWRVDAYYRDGTTEELRHTLGNGGLRDAWSYTRDLTASDVSLDEVTHLKATLQPDYDNTRDTYTTDWIFVGDVMVANEDLVPYEAALAEALAADPAAFCNVLALSGGPSLNGNSTPDTWDVCEPQALAGANIRDVLVAVALAAGGAVAIGLLLHEHADEGTTPSSEEEANPPAPWVPTPEWEDNGCNWRDVFVTEDSRTHMRIHGHLYEHRLAGKSWFYPWVDWEKLATKHAPSFMPSPDPTNPNNCRRVATHSRYIGIDRANKQRTMVYTLITNRLTGEVETMFPGPP